MVACLSDYKRRIEVEFFLDMRRPPSAAAILIAANKFSAIAMPKTRQYVMKAGIVASRASPQRSGDSSADVFDLDLGEQRRRLAADERGRDVQVEASGGCEGVVVADRVPGRRRPRS